MIFNKNVIAAIALLLSVSLQAHAHAAISPALGVKGTPKRSDVQRPTNAKPCGNVNIAQNLDSSRAIQLKPDNTFTTTIQNFNGGVDGSLQVDKVVVDATGTGSKFVAAQMVKNGVRNPPTVTSATISVKLPSGTKCQGGKNKNRCVVSLKTAGGFGNCVVVQQPKANAATATNGAKKPAASTTRKTDVKAKANASSLGTVASTVTLAESSSAAASQSSVQVSASVNATSVAVSIVATAQPTITSTIDSSVIATPSTDESTIFFNIPVETSKVLRSARAIRRAELKNRMDAA